MLLRLKRTTTYNTIVRWYRNLRRVRTGKPRSSKQLPSKLRGRPSIFLLIVLILMVGLIFLISKIALNYLMAEFHTVEDNVSASYEVENLFISVLQTGTSSEYKYIKDTYLLSFDQNSQTINVIKIDPNFVVYVPAIGEKLSIKNIYNNAVQNTTDPYVSVNSALTNLLGINSHGYMMIDEADLPTYLSYMGTNQNELNIANWHSSFSHLNFLSILIHIDKFDGLMKTSISKEQFVSYFQKFEKYRLTNEKVLGDKYGTLGEFSFGQGLEPDYKAIDVEMKSLFRQNNILAEQVRVEVFNGADVPGLAGRVARVLSNYGINVVRYTNAPRPVDDTTLYINSDKFPKSNVSLILNILGANTKTSEGFEFNSTGDLVLVLGKQE